MTVGTEVKDFIASELSVGRDAQPLTADEDLLSRGVIDSHGVMELVQFLEARYGISIADEELTPGNFQSLDAIEEFVSRKQA